MNLIRDWTRQIRLEHGLGFTREECDLYEFPRGCKDKQVLNYLSLREMRRHYWAVVRPNPQWRCLTDKWVMGLFLQAAGLPTPRTYGLLHPDFGATKDGHPLRGSEDFTSMIRRESPKSLIIKPRRGGGGVHVYRFDPVSENGQVRLSAGTDLISVQEACDRIPLRAASNHYHGWIVQERVIQHPLLAAINADSLNTVRIISFLTKRGEFRLHGAILKAGLPGSLIDNWHAGGLCIGVDPEKGLLKTGIPHGGSRSRQMDTHPNSGFRFADQPIPHWKALLKMVERAAFHFSAVRSIGWDVAITADGPVIIEANAGWHLPLVQVQSNGYLTKDVRRDLKTYGLVFPTKFPSLGVSILRLVRDKWFAPARALDGAEEPPV